MTHSFKPVPKTMASYSPSAKASVPSGNQSNFYHHIWSIYNIIKIRREMKLNNVFSQTRLIRR
jgi:hypothetical protein